MRNFHQRTQKGQNQMKYQMLEIENIRVRDLIFVLSVHEQEKQKGSDQMNDSC